jgi:hypothetical protein
LSDSPYAEAIAKLTPGGAYSIFSGSYGSGVACVDGAGTSATFSAISSMAIDLFDDIYVLQGDGQVINSFEPCNSIRKITPNGAVSTLHTFSASESTSGTLLIDASGNFYYVNNPAGTSSDEIMKLSSAGVESAYCGAESSVSASAGSCSATSIQGAGLVGFDALGRVVLTDSLGLFEIQP